MILKDGGKLVGDTPVTSTVADKVEVLGDWARLQNMRFDQRVVVRGSFCRIDFCRFRGGLEFVGPCYNSVVTACDLYGRDVSLLCRDGANEVTIVGGRIRVAECGVRLDDADGCNLLGVNIAGLKTSGGRNAVELGRATWLQSHGSRFEGNRARPLRCAYSIGERAQVYSGGDTISGTSVSEPWILEHEEYGGITHVPLRSKVLALSCQGIDVRNGNDRRPILSIDRLGQAGRLGGRTVETYQCSSH